MNISQRKLRQSQKWSTLPLNTVCSFKKTPTICIYEEDFLEEVTWFRLKIPPYRTNIGENTVKVQGVKLFNKYVNQIDLNLNTKTFKKRIKNIILPYPTEWNFQISVFFPTVCVHSKSLFKNLLYSNSKLFFTNLIYSILFYLMQF